MAKKQTRKAVDHQQEHPDDPVLVPNFALIGELMEKMTKESATPGVMEFGDLRETICGDEDDSQPVEEYDGSLGVPVSFVNANQSPVGVLRWHSNLASIYTNPGTVAGQRWCTGTLITNNLFLTAGHCFDQTGGGWQRPRVNGTSNIIEPEEIATIMSVEFNFQHDANDNLRTPTSVQVEELIEYRLGNLDFAIVRLAGSPGNQWGTTRLAPDDGNVGDMMCIIGHPAGQPKRIEAGPLTSFQGDRIRYNDIDTLGGNSGSGILRASDGCIIGVHTNGGCNSQMTGSNFGVRVSALRRESPTIQGLAAHTNPALDQIVTNRAADTLTTVVADRNTSTIRDRITTTVADRLTLATADTNAIADRLTLPQADTNTIADRITTTVRDRRTHVRDDTLTRPGRDIRGTNVTLDNPGNTNKALDDRKQGALDKQFSDRKLPGQDRIPGRGGRINPGRGRLRSEQPFVLATPHHASGVEDETEDMALAYEEAIAEIEALMEQAEQELEDLHSEYEELIAEYEAMME